MPWPDPRPRGRPPVLAHPPVCLLCGQPPLFQGVFMPFDSAEFGGVRTKQRVFRYLLCGPCVQRPDRDDAIEERLLQHVRAPWN
jgi:hypothetical protein